jgi:hypothetical protein
MWALRWLRLSSLTAAATAALLVAAGGPARADPGSSQGPQLLTVAPPLLVTGAPTWVELRWLTAQPVCDFRLTAMSTADVQVVYPSNTATHSSFYRGDSLGGLRSDYTSIHVTARQAGPAPLTLYLTYRQAAAGLCTTGTGQPVARTVQAQLGVLAAT